MTNRRNGKALTQLGFDLVAPPTEPRPLFAPDSPYPGSPDSPAAVPARQRHRPVATDGTDLAPFLSRISNLDQLDALDADARWGPVFAGIAESAGIEVALYCAYVFLGWSEIDAYQMIRGGISQNTTRAPEWFRRAAAPHMGRVVAQLMPNRLWIFSRVRDFVDDASLDGAVRGGLLRMMAQHYMEAERVAALALARDPEGKHANFAENAYGSGSPAVGNAINAAILSRGAILIVPGQEGAGDRVIEGESEDLQLESGLE